ncbi:hypothetical protein M758_7G121400 [Ceratodon purpureus]|nr:hypothetical protein M758_7G121400 [Ceratodon purpureus]
MNSHILIHILKAPHNNAQYPKRKKPKKNRLFYITTASPPPSQMPIRVTYSTLGISWSFFSLPDSFLLLPALPNSSKGPHRPLGSGSGGMCDRPT